jgi:hypothetical protein
MADMIPQGTQDYAVDNGHERGDVNISSTVSSGIVVVITVIVAMLAMAGMFRYLLKREEAKDVATPKLFTRVTRPSGPPLLPSVERDELPWVAYQNERREMEAEGAKIGIIDAKTGLYRVPNSGNPKTAQHQYFKYKYQWDKITERYTIDSSGGLRADEYTPDGVRLRNPAPRSMPAPPVRNGERITIEDRTP